MPWRPFVHYNSWYELNIDRNNVIDKRMKEDDCLKVVDAWDKHLFKPYKVGIDAFVWDDGWDDFNSLWDFYKPAFPNGFKKLTRKRASRTRERARGSVRSAATVRPKRNVSDFGIAITRIIKSGIFSFRTKNISTRSSGVARR